MTKPRLEIAPRAPRKPVDDNVARKIEEALERKSEGIAGVAHSLVHVPPASPSHAEVAEDKTSTLRPRNSDVAAKGKGKPATAPLPAAANTGLGTRANPRVRKTDGIKTRSTSIHLPIDLGLDLTMFCARHGRRQSEIVALAVRKWLDDNE